MLARIRQQVLELSELEAARLRRLILSITHNGSACSSPVAIWRHALAALKQRRPK